MRNGRFLKEGNGRFLFALQVNLGLACVMGYEFHPGKDSE